MKIFYASVCNVVFTGLTVAATKQPVKNSVTTECLYRSDEPFDEKTDPEVCKRRIDYKSYIKGDNNTSLTVNATACIIATTDPYYTYQDSEYYRP